MFVLVVHLLNFVYVFVTFLVLAILSFNMVNKSSSRRSRNQHPMMFNKRSYDGDVFFSCSSSGYHSDMTGRSSRLRDRSLGQPELIDFEDVFSDENMSPYPWTDSGIEIPSPLSTPSSSRSFRSRGTANSLSSAQYTSDYTDFSHPASLDEE